MPVITISKPIPSTPSSVAIATKLDGYTISWAVQTTTATTQVWQGTTNLIDSATLMATTADTYFDSPTLSLGTTYYVWLRHVDIYGTFSAFDRTATNGRTITISGVQSANIADNAVTAAELATGAVTSTKIANNAVTTAAINTGAVTTTSIAGNAVTATSINLPVTSYYTPLQTDASGFTSRRMNASNPLLSATWLGSGSIYTIDDNNTYKVLGDSANTESLYWIQRIYKSAGSGTFGVSSGTLGATAQNAPSPTKTTWTNLSNITSTVDNVYATIVANSSPGMCDLIFQNFNFTGLPTGTYPYSVINPDAPPTYVAGNFPTLINIKVTVTGASSGGTGSPWIKPYLIVKAFASDDISGTTHYNRAYKTTGRKISWPIGAANTSYVLQRNTFASEHLLTTHGPYYVNTSGTTPQMGVISLATLTSGLFALGIQVGGSTDTTFFVDAVSIEVTYDTAPCVYESITEIYSNDGTITDSRGFPMSSRIALPTATGGAVYDYISSVVGYRPGPFSGDNVSSPPVIGQVTLGSVIVTELKR